MVSAQIFIEGGGDGQLHERNFRRAWSEFFRSAGLSGRMPAIVRGGGRDQTYEKFAHAVRNPHARKLPVLLVDSEDTVREGETVWQHLQSRDCWSRPESARDDQAFLMVVAMETWFLADRELLKGHFGRELVESHLRAWPLLEEVPKKTVLSALQAATAKCSPPYEKGRVSFDLLAKLNSSCVEAACPHAKELLSRLRTLS